MATNSQPKRPAPGKPATAVAAVERRTRRVTIPVIRRTVEVPSEMIPYYLGIGAMAAIEVIDWPVALIIAVGHTIAARSHNRAVREVGGGVESGA